MREDQEPAGGLNQTTLDLAFDMTSSTSLAAVAEHFQSFVRNFGFGSMTCFKVPDPGEPLENCIYVSTRPQAWLDHYIAEDYVRVDPLVQEVFRTTEPFRWSDVMARPSLDPIAHLIQKQRADYGPIEGLCVPIYEAKGYSGLVTLAGEGELTPRLQTSLQVASVLLHNRLVTLGREKLLPDDLLTTREIECLKWAADGKSDWEIGQILKISSKTVNYHIENTKRKFGVPTRVQAIVYAFRFGKLG